MLLIVIIILGYSSNCMFLLLVFYKKIKKKLLKKNKHRADLCFHVYESPSIKDTKKKESGNEEYERVFSIGPKTKMETDMHDLLRLSCFKEELLLF